MHLLLEGNTEEIAKGLEAVKLVDLDAEWWKLAHVLIFVNKMNKQNKYIN